MWAEYLYFKSSYDDNKCFKILKMNFKNTCEGFYWKSDHIRD